jgi:hypothetical protein
MSSFRSFDGTKIAYLDQGEGPAVILLHGGYLDGLGQFGDFERILPVAKRQQEMFRGWGSRAPLCHPVFGSMSVFSSVRHVWIDTRSR